MTNHGLLLIPILGLMASGPVFAQEATSDATDVPADESIVAFPELLENVVADYPADALQKEQEADVALLVELDENGDVEFVEVLTSAGQDFDDAAMRAVQQMRFSPARTASGPVPVAFEFVYSFTLPKTELPDPPSADTPPDELPIIQGPAIDRYIEAPYPDAAREAGLEGEVTLLIELDETGTVLDAVVTTPAGHGFDEAALEAVKAMTFTPAKTEAGPIGVMFEFAYSFTLEPEQADPEAAEVVSVTGHLRQMGTRRDLADATVVVVELEQSVRSDSTGRFELTDIPPGVWTLKVLHPEHVELQQTVPVVQGEVTEANLWLRAVSYRSNEAVAYYEEEKQEVTRRTLTIEEVKRIPGTFGDPVKVIQTLPGAARSPFGTGLLIIRGANPEDSAVYVDGIRLPIIYHLTGTTSVLAPDIVDSVDYLPGGYGVQYGRSMAGVIDVKTKTEFGDPKLTWSTDILDTNVFFQGQLGKEKKHGFAAGVRRSYIDAFIPLLTQGQDITLRPRYWDYQAKWVPTLDNNDELSLFVYGFDDLLYAASPSDVAQGTDPDQQGALTTKYQSHRIALRYAHDFSDTFRLEMTPSIGIDINELGLGQEFGLANTNVVAQVRLETPWKPTDAVELVPGLDFIGGTYRFEFNSAISFADANDPLAERDPVGFDGRVTAWSPEVYLKANLRPLKDRDRWLITPGIRYNGAIYTYEGGITGDADIKPAYIGSFDGRLATRLQVFDGGTLKASSGLYHQPPQPFESVGLGTSVDLLAERSWNSSLGFEHRVTPAFTWDLDIFYRDMSDLVEFSNDFTGFGTQPFTNAGEGYAAGFELILRHNKTGPFFGWISYTFSRSFRRSSPDAEWVPFDFDQPHIFSAQGGVDLPFDIGLSTQIQVVSGNPETPLNAGIYDVDGDFYNGFAIGQSNSQRLPTFVQTSFRVDKTWTFRTWQLDAYLDLINAIRGVNPEATIYNYDYSEFAYLRGLPFIPNLGFEVRFFP